MRPRGRGASTIGSSPGYGYGSGAGESGTGVREREKRDRVRDRSEPEQGRASFAGTGALQIGFGADSSLAHLFVAVPFVAGSPGVASQPATKGTAHVTSSLA